MPLYINPKITAIREYPTPDGTRYDPHYVGKAGINMRWYRE